MAHTPSTFRVGRVSAQLRGRIWYLCYHQDGRRYRPRVGPDRQAARQLAAQVNAQLEVHAPTALSYEPIAIPALREQWLSHHEHVLRSSVATVRRYRAATHHLIAFVEKASPPRLASHFQPRHAEAFATHLRGIQVAPNGHVNAGRRPLRDKGIKFILETCRAMFNYAAKRRHLSPYAENPFTAIEIDRIPIEDARPFAGFTEHQEREFLDRCDDWQFPVFLTLLLTGLRPGELTHLLLPDDLDMSSGWLWIRNKPDLGWQVKTRNERRIPLVPELIEVLRAVNGTRQGGTVFLRRRFRRDDAPPLVNCTRLGLQEELATRLTAAETRRGQALTRSERQQAAATVWRDLGLVKADRIRLEFMRITESLGLPKVTAPKTLRHMFATCLQDANVDPLIRNQLMGHAPAGAGTASGGLGMTGVYTHTRPETVRRQLENALRASPAVLAARQWLARRTTVEARCRLG